eukprot:gene7463-9525_t
MAGAGTAALSTALTTALPTQRRAQAALDRLDRWAAHTHWQLSTAKSEVILLSPTPKGTRKAARAAATAAALGALAAADWAARVATAAEAAEAKPKRRRHLRGGKDQAQREAAEEEALRSARGQRLAAEAAAPP